MELKEIVNLLSNEESNALDSIGYEDADVINMVFTIDGVNQDETQTIELTYTNKNDFTIKAYSFWEGEKSDFVDQGAFYFISNIIHKLNAADSCQILFKNEE